MENAIEIQVSPSTLAEGNNTARAKTLQRLSIVEWYRILRVHHHWTIFQAIRFALWLAR